MVFSNYDLALIGRLDSTFVVKSEETVILDLSVVFIALTINAMLIVEQNLILFNEGERADLKSYW